MLGNSAPGKLTGFVNNIAFDVAGLGCIGGAIYALLFTKDTAAFTGLVGLAGGYLGFKAPTGTTTNS